mgnify:CR=1 FL=1
MPEWLRIDTNPPAQIYAHDGARASVDLSLPTHRVDSITAGDDREQIGRQNNEFAVSITGAGSALVSRLTAQVSRSCSLSLSLSARAFGPTRARGSSRMGS